jgi:N-acetylated-alpha-linked acidic dipeptidase
MREETTQKNRLINDKVFEMVADPTQPYVVAKLEEPVPFINFAPLQNALVRLQDSSRRYDSAMSAMVSTGRLPAPEAARSLDEILIRTERAMTRNEGLPRRSWFKHQIYAPGFYTGYGVKTLPAVREAIEQRNWREASEQVSVVARIIEGVAAEIDRATQKLR